MKRIFFAIDVHPDGIMANVLAQIRDRLKGEKIRWIPQDQLHLTLKFLGDTPEDEIENIVNAVAAPLGEISAMILELFSTGLFKNLQNPRIIWIGIKPCSALQQAVQILNEGTKAFVFKEDKTEFLPHLTIGRVKEIKQKEGLTRLMERYQNESFGKASVREIVLYESVLKPEGPLYIALKRFELG